MKITLITIAIIVALDFIGCVALVATTGDLPYVLIGIFVYLALISIACICDEFGVFKNDISNTL